MGSITYNIEKMQRIQTEAELSKHHRILWVDYTNHDMWQEYEIINIFAFEAELVVIADSENEQVDRVFNVDLHDLFNKWYIFPIQVPQYNNLWLALNDTSI